MHEMIMNFCGYATTALNMISYLPQIIKILKTKHADDVSMSSWVLWVLSAVVWMIYAVLDGGIGILLAQLSELALTTTVFVLTLKYKDSRKGKMAYYVYEHRHFSGLCNCPLEFVS